MSYSTLLISLAAVDLLAAMSPGPNFVLVTQSAIHRSKRYALAVVAGFVVSNLVWCAGVVLGLSSLFSVAPWLYRTIKVVGGAYLIYLGVQLWRNATRESRPSAETEETFVQTRRVALTRGLLTNMANPKSVVYFGSVFAVFMAPGTPVWVQFVAICVVLVNTCLWYGAVAMLFSSCTIQRMYRRVRRMFDRIAGGLMAGFGTRLVFARD